MSALPPEDDRTIMPSAAGTTGVASTTAQENDSNALPAGIRLGEFEIVGVIGIGGFSIVYLAYDHSLHRKIALKEYMPTSLAARSGQSHVSVKSGRHAETFQAGMRSFINEARLLAQFDHPSLVKVYRFWEANGTAYLAMPLYEGLTLTQTLRGRDVPPDEAWLRALLAPLLDALETIHREQCFHRDIAPDNIMMLADDRPLLLDFGAARRAISGMTQAFTVILKPGYAPIEQYAEVASMQQGAWTDIYALGSVIHFAITGRPPAPSVARMISDPQVPLAQSAAGRYGEAFLQVIDRALAVKPGDRPQSVAELRSMLGVQSAGPRQASNITQPLRKPPEPRLKPTEPLRENASTDTKRPGNTLTRTMVIGAVLVLAIAAGSIFVVTRNSAPPPSLSKPPVDKELLPNVPVQATAPPLSAEGGLQSKAPAPVDPLPTPVVIEPSVAKPADPIPVAQPVDPIEAIEQIFQARNRDHEVTVMVKTPQVEIGKDGMQFSIRSSRAGYVYLMYVGSDRSLLLLFPNAKDKNNSISATKPLALPRPSWPMVADGPPSIDQFVAIVSESQRDFVDVGLQPKGRYVEIPLVATMRPGRENSATAPVIAGKANCASGRSAACPESYGAARFSIEEIPAR